MPKSAIPGPRIKRARIRWMWGGCQISLLNWWVIRELKLFWLNAKWIMRDTHKSAIKDVKVCPIPEIMQCNQRLKVCPIPEIMQCNNTNSINYEVWGMWERNRLAQEGNLNISFRVPIIYQKICKRNKKGQ